MGDVRFGSLAVVQLNFSLMAASGAKAAVRNAEIHEIEGPLSATCGQCSKLLCANCICPVSPLIFALYLPDSTRNPLLNHFILLLKRFDRM